LRERDEQNRFDEDFRVKGTGEDEQILTSANERDLKETNMNRFRLLQMKGIRKEHILLK